MLLVQNESTAAPQEAEAAAMDIDQSKWRNKACIPNSERRNQIHHEA